jgi:REP element-mobilizing transposase RayT
VNWRAFHLEEDGVKAHLARLMTRAARELHVTVYAYAFMDNHLHAAVRSPPADLYRRLTSRRTACRHLRAWPAGHQNSSVISQFMRKIRAPLSQARHRDLGLSGRFWEGPYDARVIDSALSLAVRVAYDHRNPVKAGMVAAPEDYRWSSARAWVEGCEGDVPVELRSFPFDADPASLRRDILLYQGTAELDTVDGLDEILWDRRATTESIRTALEQAGVPIRECGSGAAL